MKTHTQISSMRAFKDFPKRNVDVTKNIVKEWIGEIQQRIVRKEFQY